MVLQTHNSRFTAKRFTSRLQFYRFTVVSLSLCLVCSISVVIGAPKAHTKQVNVTEGGSVFYCPWSLSQSDCHTIEFDTEGEHHDTEIFGKCKTKVLLTICKRCFSDYIGGTDKQGLKVLVRTLLKRSERFPCFCCQQQVVIRRQRSTPLSRCWLRWFLDAG